MPMHLAACLLKVRMTADEPSFSTGSCGGGGVPGSKARVMQRLQELGWQDALQVGSTTAALALLTRCLHTRSERGMPGQNAHTMSS